MVTEDATEARSIAKIDGVIIDELTGEVLEYPDGWQGDLIDHLIRAGVDAKYQARDWDRAHDMYRFALGKMLNLRGIERYASNRAGQVVLRHQTRRSATLATLDRLIASRKIRKLTGAAIIARCLESFNVEQLEALASSIEASSPKEARAIREELIETKITRFIQLDAPKRTAPRIYRSTIQPALPAGEATE